MTNDGCRCDAVIIYVNLIDSKVLVIHSKQRNAHIADISIPNIIGNKSLNCFKKNSVANINVYIG